MQTATRDGKRKTAAGFRGHCKAAAWTGAALVAVAAAWVAAGMHAWLCANLLG